MATKLGGAMLTAVSDFGFQRSRRKFNGLSNATMLPQYLKLMRPGSAEAQKMAVRRGLIAEEWAHRTAGQNRLFMEEMTGALPRALANGVLRVSGLNRHTQSMRWVYGMETLATYTEAAGRTFAELEPELRSALARYGLDAADWDKLRSAPMDQDGGVEWISPHNAEDPQLAARFMEMVHGEKDLAVPVADLETRATFNSMFPKGTWRGELGRSTVQFKSFGLAVMLAQTREIMAMNGGTAARYAAGLVIGTTLMGAIAMQLKALAAGKDLRPMDDAPRVWNDDGEWEPSGGFWAAAMFQGGGLGIAGDFFFSAESRTGQGFGSWLAGPTLSDAQKLVNTATAKDPRKSAVRTAKAFVPGNNIWFSRAAFDRMVADAIDEAINPDIRNSRRRMQRYAEEQGTAYWWAPGDRAPDRSPDFANALEEGPEQ